MISERGYARVRGVLERRKRPVAATMLIATPLLCGLAWILPPGYRASAVVRALESQPAREYVPPTVAEPLGERLKTLRLAVMARPIIAAVVDDLHLAQALHRSPAEVVEAIRGKLEVKVEGEDTFLVSYEDRYPDRARGIVNRIARVFMERQLDRRQELAAAAVESLTAEVAALRPALARSEEALRSFKLAHYGALPEQQETNLRALDQTTMEVNIQSTNLDLERERRRQLLASAMSPLRHQEELLTSALHEARTRYTPDHPEVRRIAAELATVHNERVADDRMLRDALRGGNPELRQLEQEIGRTYAQLDALRKRQTELRQRVTETAKNAHALAHLNTDYEVLHAKYQATLGKLHDTELAAGLEKSLRPHRYQLVEAAPLPLRPAHPNRALLTILALILALAAALGLAFAIDFLDTRIYSAEEIGALHPSLEVIAVMPDEERKEE